MRAFSHLFFLYLQHILLLTIKTIRKMEKMKRLIGWLCLLMVATVLTSCSKSSDSDNEGGSGGGIKPDPNIPTLSEAKYEMAPLAIIVPESTTKQLTAVDTIAHRLTLPASADKPEVGQTLVFSTPTKDLPYGLLAKVKSVSESGSGYIVNYEDAELKDAFKDIEIPESYIPLGNYVERIIDADGKEIKFARKATTRATGEKNFLIQLPEVGWKITEGLEITPQMSIDMMMRFAFTYGDYELSYCGLNIDADVTVGATLNATIDEKSLSKYPKRIYLFTMVCGAIPIPPTPIVINPAIDVYGIVKGEGKFSLEATISYERTLHAKVRYQKGAGLSCDMNADPEAPDALKFTFGPKFEGGFAYGVSMGGYLGFYGKTLGLRVRLNALKKETISGKLNLLAFAGTMDEWLTPYDVTYHSGVDMTKDGAFQRYLKSLDYILKWKFNEFEDLMYNQAIAFNLGADLHFIGKDVVQYDLPEISMPISSTPIMPQIKIEEKDFFEFNDNDVTLKLHHAKNSVLDDLTEFRAELTPVGKDGKANVDKKIVKYFDFDDEKRQLLAADSKAADVTSTAKATLDGESNYDVTVYMNILDVDIPIFKSKAKLEEEKDVTIKSIRCTFAYRMQHGTSGAQYSYLDMWWNEQDITVNHNGDNYEIYARSKNTKDYTTETKYAKFKFTRLEEGKYSDVSSVSAGYEEECDNGKEAFYSHYKVDFTATNIAFDSKSSSNYAYWTGTHSTGMGISDFTYTDQYDWEEHYYEHSDNKLELCIEFK